MLIAQSDKATDLQFDSHVPIGTVRIHCKRKILKLSLKKYSVTGAYIEYDILKFSMHEYSIFAQSE